MRIKHKKCEFRKTARPVTHKRLAKAHRAVKREFKNFPFFPEMVRYKTAKERLAMVAGSEFNFRTDQRKHRAEECRKGRKLIRIFPQTQKMVRKSKLDSPAL